RRLLDSLMLVHCPKGAEGGKAKVDCLVLIFRKLMALVRGDIAPDNADAMDVQELLLPGQLFGALLKEVLQSSLLRLEGALAKKSRQAQVGKGRAPTVLSAELIRNTFMGVCDVTKRMESFLATGNLTSRSGLDLQQTTGFTVVADKLNAYRYLSHFRAVHRGSFFQEMKTTSVRKLLPETWGFLCPVHTPDGTPCGLLNHLAAPCQPVVRVASPEGVIPGLEAELASLGVQLVRSS
ncbi:DNA-directed RNA polymerase I subunit RPA2, partial [Perkinsus olseni]